MSLLSLTTSDHGKKTTVKGLIQNENLSKCIVCKQSFNEKDHMCIQVFTWTNGEFKLEALHANICLDNYKQTENECYYNKIKLIQRHVQRYAIDSNNIKISLAQLGKTYLEVSHVPLIHFLRQHEPYDSIFVSPSLSVTTSVGQRLYPPQTREISSSTSLVVYVPIPTRLSIQNGLFSIETLRSFFNRVTVVNIPCHNTALDLDAFMKYITKPENKCIDHWDFGDAGGFTRVTTKHQLKQIKWSKIYHVKCYGFLEDIESDEKNTLKLIVSGKIIGNDTMMEIELREILEEMNKSMGWIEFHKRMNEMEAKMEIEMKEIVNKAIDHYKTVAKIYNKLTMFEPSVHMELRSSQLKKAVPITSNSGKEYLIYHQNAQQGMNDMNYNKLHYFIPEIESTQTPLLCYEGYYDGCLPLYYNDYTAITEEIRIINDTQTGKLKEKKLISFHVL
jgi:hypothetical protein